MSQSLVQSYLHLIFSTKNRTPYLSDEELRTRVHAYLAGTCNDLSSPATKVGGVEDHVHILCRQSKTLSIATLIKEVKRESSKWIKELDPTLRHFYWQAGYGAFSVSPSHMPALTAYIEQQVEHHRRESFQDEFRRICAKYGVDIDERHVWD